MADIHINMWLQQALTDRVEELAIKRTRQECAIEECTFVYVPNDGIVYSYGTIEVTVKWTNTYLVSGAAVHLVHLTLEDIFGSIVSPAQSTNE